MTSSSLSGHRRDDVGAPPRSTDTQPDAHEVIGWIQATFEYRWAESGEAFRKARALAPGDGKKLVALATLEAIWGRFEEALRLSEEAAALDPLSDTTQLFLSTPT